jgi:hypothetical protein
MTELIAAEKTGTKTRRKISAIAAGTELFFAHQPVPPGLARWTNMRIGVPAQHRLLDTSLIDYSWKRRAV